MTPPSLAEFVSAAREYCTLAEREGSVTTADLWSVRDLLLRLIYHIAAVEAAPQSADHDGARPDASFFAKVATRFGGFPFNYYRMIFDPHDFDATDEPVVGMLSDDLTGIYQDIAEGLDNADKGHLSDACFDWALGYRTHWALHATNALTAIEKWRTDHCENVEPAGADQPATRPDSKAR